MQHSNNVPDTYLLGENDWLAVTEVCRLCSMELAALVELVELGVTVSRGPAPAEWTVPANALPRLLLAGRLMRDLGLDVTGAALAVELLESRRELEQRIRRLERLLQG